jgi:hypothetical protein
MSDMVEILRQKARGERNALGDVWGDHICNQAADEIDRLREAADKAQWTTSDDMLEAFAKQLAERINGGGFYDPTFYTEEQRDLWRGHAAYLMGLMR